MMHRYFEVRMLVKDESLRIKDIVKQTGYDKGHVSRLRKASQLDKLIADAVAAEREKLAAWMMRQGYATGHGDTTEDLLKQLDWQIDERIAAEREACATLCDQMFHDWCNQEFEDEDEAYKNKPDAEDCKKAIRARGNA
jgi:hypothetical protein